MSSSSSSSSGGIGVLGLLGVVFVTFKLIGMIDWSWWLVTLPFWGVLVFVIVIVGVIFFGWLFALLLKDRANKRKRLGKAKRKFTIGR